MVSDTPEVCWCTPSRWSGHDCTNTAKVRNIFHFCSTFPSQFPHSQALLLEPNRPELHLGCPLRFLSVKYYSNTICFKLYESQERPVLDAAWQAGRSVDFLWGRTVDCDERLIRVIATMLPLRIPYTRDSLFPSGCPASGFSMHLRAAEQGTT